MRRFLLLCMVSLGIGAMAQTTVTIGAGASTSGTSDNGSPIYRSSSTSSFHYSKSVQLLTAADLNGATVFSGSVINAVGYYKTTAFNVSGSNAWTMNVYLKNSSATALASGTSWDTMTTGATLFYTATINANNNFPSAAGWVNYANNTGNVFNYTGGSIEVYIDWVPSGTLTSPYTGGTFQWKYDTSTTAQALGTSNSAAIPGTTTSFTTQTRRYQTQLTFTSNPCSGTPNPGNTLSSGSTVCAGPYNTTLSLQNSTVGSGVTYQWYANGAAVTGATSSTYTTTVTAATSYYCAVTCSGSGATTNSTTINLAAPSNGISTFPWNENFDSMTSLGANVLPSCWLSVPGGSSSTTHYTTATSAGNTYNDPRSAPNYVTIYYPYTNAATLWTPKFYLTAGQSYDFSFYYVGDGLTGWQGDVLVNTIQDGANANTLTSFATPNQATTGGANSTNYTKVKVTYVPTATGNYTFGVKTLATTSAPYYMGFDDFNVMPSPACTEPSGLAATNVTTNSATLSWTAPATVPGNGYDLYYSTSNTAPTATTTPNYPGLTTTSQGLSNLTSATVYYAWVRSKCTATENSVWFGPYQFTTGITNDNCSAPIALTVGSTFASNAIVGTNTGSTVDETPLSCQTSANNNVWYSVVVPASGNLTVETNAVTGSPYTDSVLNVFSGTCGNLVEAGCDDDNGDGNFSKVVLTGQTPGTTLLISVWRWSNSSVSDGQFMVSAYDSSILAANEVKGEAKNSIKVYPNPFSDVLNISDIAKVKTILVADVAGRLVKTIANPASSLQLGELKQGMYLVTLEMKDGSKQTIKTIKK